ncbi:MAG: cation diffusion facilitator family transporter [Corynebacterium sp.]|nr:cation diffusion facilitator family transporter [Corynebacterium sp.]
MNAPQAEDPQLRQDHSHDHSHSHSHGHDHAHHGGHTHDHHVPETIAALMVVLVMSLVIFVAEVLAGIFSGSLSLLADSAHMFSDVLGLVLAAVAIMIGRKQGSATATYGNKRAEVMAAAFNAIFVSVVCVWIVVEAVERLGSHEPINTGMMLIVAVIGLVANFISAMMLVRKQHESLNLKGAYLHVLSDLFGSIAVVVAGLVIRYTGFHAADTIASLIIAGIILPRTWKLLRQSMRVLMEWTPENVDNEEVIQRLLEVDGVEAVHDLHLWSVDGADVLCTAHLVVDDLNKNCKILCAANSVLEDMGIGHSTLQVESSEHSAIEPADLH